MNYPRGLVRYDTQNGLAQHLTTRQRMARIFRPRVLVYSAVLGLIMLGFSISLALRSPFRVDVVHDRAAMARLVDDGQIENVYRLQIMNATEQAQHYRVAVQGLPDILLDTLPEIQLASAEARWVTLAVRIPPESAVRVGAGAHPIHFEIDLLGADAAGQTIVAAAVSEKSTFIVPR
jgi:polyferredoxin